MRREETGGRMVVAAGSQAVSCMGANPPRPVLVPAGQDPLVRFRFAGGRVSTHEPASCRCGPGTSAGRARRASKLDSQRWLKIEGGGGESAQEPFASRWQGGLVSERVCRPAERGLFAGKKLVVRWMWRQASVSQAASCMGGNPPRPVRARAGQASLAQFRLAGALRQARARCLPQRARCLRRRVSAWPQVAFSALAENRGGGGECVQEPSESRWEGGLASHKPAISQGQGMHLESADQRSRPRRSP